MRAFQVYFLWDFLRVCRTWDGTRKEFHLKNILRCVSPLFFFKLCNSFFFFNFHKKICTQFLNTKSCFWRESPPPQVSPFDDWSLVISWIDTTIWFDTSIKLFPREQCNRHVILGKRVLLRLALDSALHSGDITGCRTWILSGTANITSCVCHTNPFQQPVFVKQFFHVDSGESGYESQGPRIVPIMSY